MQIGPYRLVEQLGRGGNAVVFRARGPRGEDCAVKVLHREDRTAKQRFLREAQVLADLSHPAIVPLRSVGEHKGSLYLAMPYYAGRSLATRIEDEGPLRPLEAVELAQSLADGLAYVHGHGVLHRDLKPDNVLLDIQGTARLTDFGLARRTDLEETRLSKSGALMGTPGFWAPEQAGGEHGIGAWTDVYGLGATLYCMLTGVPPLSGANLVEVMQAVNEREAKPPSAHVPGIDAELDRICLRCLAKRPDDRFPSARALQDALASYLRGESTQRRRPRVLLGVAALGALALGGAFALWAATRGGAAPPVELPAAVEPANALGEVEALLADEEALAALRALDALPSPDTPEALFLRAEALLQLGDLDAAHAASAAVLERAPEHLAARIQLARIDLARGDRYAALEGLAVAIERGAGADAVLLRAELHDLGGDVAAADRELEKLIEREPDHRLAWQRRLGYLESDPERRFEVVEQALARFPDDVGFLRLRGRLNAAFGRHDDAIRDLDRLVQRGQAQAIDFVLCSLTRSALNDRQGALADAQRAVGMQPGFAPGWRELGVNLYELGRVSMARHALAHALALDPHDLRSYASLGQVCYTLGDYRWSVSLIDHALSRDDPRSATLYFLLGSGLLKLARFDVAERAFDRALESQPTNPGEIRGLRGTARLGQERDREARGDLIAGVGAQPDNSLWWYNLAVVHLNLEEAELAVRALQRYLELSDEAMQEVEFLQLYAMALTSTERLDEAREVQAALCALVPEEGQAWFELGKLCLRTKQLDEGLAAAKRAHELKPESIRAGCLLADVHAARGEIVKCTDVMSDLIVANVGEPKLRLILAEHLYAAEHYPLAETMLDGYLKDVPRDGQAYGRRAAARLEQGKLRDALGDLNRALALEPKDLSSRYNRALIYLRVGHAVEALGDLAQARIDAPHDGDVIRVYARALHLLGRSEEARVTLDAFLQAHPDHLQAEELRGLMASLPRLR